MTLQNRVTPFGGITADAGRGTLMGNRGGRIHDPATKTLLRRRWASRQWIICVLEIKDRHREVMGAGYTELFFLDEITALAAGHRPCFECRRQAAKAFFAAHHEPLLAPQMDRLLHGERLQCDVGEVAVAGHPDGVVFAGGEQAWALKGGYLLRWTPAGYDCAVPRDEMPRLRPLTPPTTIAILAAGFTPVWHESAFLL